MLDKDEIATYADEHPGFWEALARRLVAKYNQEAATTLKFAAETLERHHYRMGYLHGLRWVIEEAQNMGREADRPAPDNREEN